MLALSRRFGESVRCRCACGALLTVKVIQIQTYPRQGWAPKVRLSFDAPLTTRISRVELEPPQPGETPAPTPPQAS